MIKILVEILEINLETGEPGGKAKSE